ncbi:hypothetical protein RN607_03560 [Demequina capsici]|uniref:Uncharacterized protein n=1 Tax=Demequina capsici TaxID=3075620 RepID=A0AA96JA81_9MICO|nr:hypothetical protein [Demequina sp. PMTSA13]WNM28092.1 hypothetical protein RN607_03560 [Demequina sp. PMTSA13]
MASTTTPEWQFDGTFYHRGTTIGGWQVVQTASLDKPAMSTNPPEFHADVVVDEPEFHADVVVDEPEFHHDMQGVTGNPIVGIAAAREAARQLLAACDYAEKHFTA